MDIFLIDYMISDIPINLPYIMIRTMIITHGQKQKSISYSQVLTSIFEHF
jgi:hypothetical protein